MRISPDEMNPQLQAFGKAAAGKGNIWTNMDDALLLSVLRGAVRVARPRDKAKAEAGVLLVERWILARIAPSLEYAVSSDKKMCFSNAARRARY